jgi:hypothetical protein
MLDLHPDIHPLIIPSLPRRQGIAASATGL